MTQDMSVIFRDLQVTAPDVVHAQLRAIGGALDGLGIAMCVFDLADRALAWNDSFLRFFPEHAGHVHAGEHYRENLRRFYRHRLSSEEMPLIERYIDEGVERHRTQVRPYEFEHGGRRLTVSATKVDGIGRVRVWRAETTACPPAPVEPQDELAILELVPDGVAVCDGAGIILWSNPAFADIYRLSPGTRINGLSLDAVYRLAWSRAPSLSMGSRDEGLAILGEQLRWEGAPFELMLPDDRWCRVIAHRAPDGRRWCTHVDITALKRKQRELVTAERVAKINKKALREKSALLEATLEHMSQGVILVNARGMVDVCNRRALELLDLPEAFMASKPSFADLVEYQRRAGEFDDASPEMVGLLGASNILTASFTYERRRPNGRVIEIHSAPVKNGGVVRTYVDITERRRDEARMLHEARHDPLTELANRLAFNAAVASALQDAREPFAIHYVDLDGFKPINDTFGHATGDRVLGEVAKRIRSVARGQDVVARVGGDEFAILQRGVHAEDAAYGLGRRILKVLAEPLTTVPGSDLRIGASIGVAGHPVAGASAEELLANADRAMYVAKATGRNQVRVFTALET